MEPLLSRPAEARVLHVDDQEAFLDVTATCLDREMDDVILISETDPKAGLDHVVDGRVDCIVSDYEMPGMDGLEFLDAVRDHDSEIPFVLFTGKGSEDVAAKAIEAGVSSYLRKKSGQAQFAVLANRIETLVDQDWARRRARKMEQTHELIVRTATDAFWIRNMETGETLYSEGIRRFGYEPGIREDGFEWWAERVHPQDRADSRDLNTLQREGSPEGFDTIDGEFGEFTHQYRWRDAAGAFVPLTSRGIVRFENGEPVEMVGAMTKRDESSDDSS
jgi:CheY-like chemotaxis protein